MSCVLLALSALWLLLWGDGKWASSQALSSLFLALCVSSLLLVSSPVEPALRGGSAVAISVSVWTYLIVLPLPESSFELFLLWPTGKKKTKTNLSHSGPRHKVQADKTETKGSRNNTYPNQVWCILMCSVLFPSRVYIYLYLCMVLKFCQSSGPAKLISWPNSGLRTSVCENAPGGIGQLTLFSHYRVKGFVPF